jgi:hypothetical protein
MAITLFLVVPFFHGTCFLLKFLDERTFQNVMARSKACALEPKAGETKGNKAPLASASEVEDADTTGGTEKCVTFEQEKGNWEVMQPMRSTAPPPPLVVIAKLSPGRTSEGSIKPEITKQRQQQQQQQSCSGNHLPTRVSN